MLLGNPTASPREARLQFSLPGPGWLTIRRLQQPLVHALTSHTAASLVKTLLSPYYSPATEATETSRLFLPTHPTAHAQCHDPGPRRAFRAWRKYFQHTPTTRSPMSCVSSLLLPKPSSFLLLCALLPPQAKMTRLCSNPLFNGLGCSLPPGTIS